MVGAATTIGPAGALLYIGGILAFFTILAAVCDGVEKLTARRRRDQARAEARASRRKEQESSDVEWGFSWQSP